MTVNVDDVVATYMKLRYQKEQIEGEAKTKVDALKVKMLKLEAWIKEQADLQGVTSFKTKHGTAFLTTTDFANVADWDAVKQFIIDNDAYDMLEKRVSKIAVRGYIEQNKVVPPGVNYGTKLEVNIRKPAPGAD
jgi:translation initiation factor IF-3